MEYNVYIDESGSINNFNRGVFEVALLFVESRYDKRSRKFFKKKFLKFKNNNNIDLKTEVKAHYLRRNNCDNFLDEIFEDARMNNKIVSGYINNRRITNTIMRRSNNEEFFHMIELLIERAISRSYINEGDSLKILCDNRTNINSEIRKLERNSFSRFNITIDQFEFIDSSSDIMIQIVDIVSAKCFRDIMNKLSRSISIESKANLSIREIFY